MILPVYVYGQPVLRKVAEDITPDYPNLKELIQNMFETMDHADGVGLAAPQIGLPIRVVVVDLDVYCRKIIPNIKVSVRHISMRISSKYRAKKYLWKKAA